MRFTEAKADQFESMMKSFASKHGLGVDIMHFTFDINNEYSDVRVSSPNFKLARYMFRWNEVTSLSEGAAYIFADVINRFHLKRESIDHKFDLFAEYARNDVEATINMRMNFQKGNIVLQIQDVIFNNPATIIKWADGTKTVVKTQNGETYDPEKGLAMAIAKKALGNKGNYYNEIQKWLGKYEEPIEYPNIPSLLIKLSSSFDPNPITELRNTLLKEVLNHKFGLPKEKDIISDVNDSIENTFTKDSLN